MADELKLAEVLTTIGGIFLAVAIPAAVMAFQVWVDEHFDPLWQSILNKGK
jgi:hypothetical protein